MLINNKGQRVELERPRHKHQQAVYDKLRAELREVFVLDHTDRRNRPMFALGERARLVS